MKKTDKIRNVLDFYIHSNELKNVIIDEHETLEAIHSYYIDKIEADLQSKIYLDKGMHHSLNDQDNNVVFKSSRVRQMLKDGAKDAFDIWYEWDKNIYFNDNQFSEFIHILNSVKASTLIKPINKFVPLLERRY